MKLFWKIYLLSLALVILSVGVLTTVLTLRARERSLSSLRADQGVLAAIAASQVEAGYHEETWPFEMLACLSRNSSFVAWRIADGNGGIVLTSAPAANGPGLAVPANSERAQLAEPALVPGAAPTQEVWVVPLRMRTGFHPWTFQLEFHTLAVRQQVRRIILTNVLLASAIAVVLVPVMLVVTRRLVKPLERLTTAVQGIGQGNLDVSLPEAGSDETGQLTQAFQCMIRDLRQTMVSRDYVDSILNCMLDMLVVVDGEGRIVTVNRAACQLLGYREEELLGQPIDRIAGSAQGRPAGLRAILSGEQTPGSCEMRWTTRDGRTIPVFLSGSVFTGREGLAARMVLTAKDITDLRQAEEELRQSEEKVRQLQRLEAVGQLAGGVAHDFNNILTGISGYTQLTLQELAPDSPLREGLHEVQQLAHRAADLTRQLLAFGRRQTLEPVVLDLNDLVRDVARMLGRLLGEHVNISVATADGLGKVRADRAQIEQVLLNLAVNARDAMPAGGRLTIQTANVSFDQNYTDRHGGISPGQFVMLAVSDTGSGMDRATQERVFEPFFTTKEVGKGTGLGLATVFGIVKQHGGHIWVYSEPGHGSTFKVYLPRAQQAASGDDAGPTDKGSPARQTTGGSETVLLVEDEPAVRKLAQSILTRQGYTVLCASCPAEAEDLFAQHRDRIDLLLSDVVMPGGSGPELYNRLVREKPGLAVLYMSGYTERAIPGHAWVDERTAFIQKPFTPQALAAKVRQALAAGAGQPVAPSRAGPAR